MNHPDQTPQPPRPHATDVFVCPLDPCDWKYSAPALFEMREAITPDELETESAQRTRGIEQALTLHFNHDHTGTEWAREVSRLRQLLRAAPPLICAHCYVDRHNARQAGEPLPPQELAQLIINGSGVCPGHLLIVDGPPPAPGRTGSGLIVPGA